MDDYVRTHQTLVMIRSGTPVDRVHRLVDSLNRKDGDGGTIKADVKLYHEGQLVPYTPYQATVMSKETPDCSVEEFVHFAEKFAHMHGYTMCVPVFKPDMVVTDEMIDGLKEIAQDN